MLSRLKNWLKKSGINPMVKVIENPKYPLARVYRDSVFQGIVDTFDVLMGNHFDFDNNGSGRKGVLDILILPLISRKIFFEFISTMAWNPAEPKMTFKKGLRFFGLEIAAIPAAIIEVSRTVLGLALTLAITPVVVGVHSIAYFKARTLKNKIQELQVLDATPQNSNTKTIQQSLAEWMRNNKIADVNQLEYIAEEPGLFRKKTKSLLFPDAKLSTQKFKLAPDVNTTDIMAAYEELNLGKHVRMR
jgi:hypothetical protein